MAAATSFPFQALPYELQVCVARHALRTDRPIFITAALPADRTTSSTTGQTLTSIPSTAQRAAAPRDCEPFDLNPPVPLRYAQQHGSSSSSAAASGSSSAAAYSAPPLLPTAADERALAVLCRAFHDAVRHYRYTDRALDFASRHALRLFATRLGPRRCQLVTAVGFALAAHPRGPFVYPRLAEAFPRLERVRLMTPAYLRHARRQIATEVAALARDCGRLRELLLLREPCWGAGDLGWAREIETAANRWLERRWRRGRRRFAALAASEAGAGADAMDLDDEEELGPMFPEPPPQLPVAESASTAPQVPLPTQLPPGWDAIGLPAPPPPALPAAGSDLPSDDALTTLFDSAPASASPSPGPSSPPGLPALPPAAVPADALLDEPAFSDVPEFSDVNSALGLSLDDAALCRLFEQDHDHTADDEHAEADDGPRHDSLASEPVPLHETAFDADDDAGGPTGGGSGAAGPLAEALRARLDRTPPLLRPPGSPSADSRCYCATPAASTSSAASSVVGKCRGACAKRRQSSAALAGQG